MGIENCTHRNESGMSRSHELKAKHGPLRLSKGGCFYLSSRKGFVMRW